MVSWVFRLARSRRGQVWGLLPLLAVSLLGNALAVANAEVLPVANALVMLPVGLLLAAWVCVVALRGLTGRGRR